MVLPVRHAQETEQILRLLQKSAENDSTDKEDDIVAKLQVL